MNMFEFHLYEPFISQVYNGIKEYEGRIPLPSVLALKPSTIVPVFLLDSPNHVPLFHVRIESIHRYTTFRDALMHLGVERVLPGMSFEEALHCYDEYIHPTIQKIDGIVMIRMSRVNTDFAAEYVGS